MKAIITGITGQDGHYLAKLLLYEGYEVYGFVRKVHNRPLDGLEGVCIYEGDITDQASVSKAITQICPNEIYHLASQSDVAYSFVHPEETYHTNIDGTLHVLNAVQSLHGIKDIKVYFAGTSEMFGNPQTVPQAENTPMKPVSPYGVSKLAGFWTAKVYRESYGLSISCGIAYNHESELRPTRFVTRKITMGIADYLRTHKAFQLGNLDAKKDWGYAPDYVDGMWRMLQHESDDYVLATGEMHTVREFLETALEVAGIDYIKTSGKNSTTEYVDVVHGNGRYRNNVIVSTTKQLYRPSEADNYMGDYSKAKRELGWKPKIMFKELVKLMMKHDLESANNGI